MALFPHGPPPRQANLSALKFYDANANGVNDDNQLIPGWQIFISQPPGFAITRFTPVAVTLDPGPYTVASGATRTHQEALKNALDKANNNLDFVQAAPCPFSFAQ